MKHKKILILGAYGRKNVGDDVFLKVILDNLRGHDVTFNCWETSNLPPEISTKSSRIVSSKLTKSIEIFKAVLHTDIVLYGGGELWMRLEGTTTPNLSTYKMLFVNTLARLLNKKVIYISVGSENLRGWSRLLASMSARLANSVYFRDYESAATLKLRNYNVTPDIAYIYKYDTSNKRKQKQSIDDIQNILICPTRLTMDDESRNKRNIVTLSSELRKLFPKVNFTVLAAMSDEQAPESDIESAEMLKELLGESTTVYRYNSINKLIDVLSKNDIVVSYRLHISILSHLAYTPVVGIGYKPKVRKYYDSYSIRQSFCDSEKIPQHLGSAIAETIVSTKLQFARTAEVRQEAIESYAKIFKQIQF